MERWIPKIDSAHGRTKLETSAPRAASGLKFPALLLGKHVRWLTDGRWLHASCMFGWWPRRTESPELGPSQASVSFWHDRVLTLDSNSSHFSHRKYSLLSGFKEVSLPKLKERILHTSSSPSVKLPLCRVKGELWCEAWISRWVLRYKPEQWQ